MVRQRADWIADARESLVRLLIAGQGWDYAGEGIARTEPTALACLALRGNQAEGDETRAGTRWLASVQQANGAVGISETVPAPEWPTPYAALAWTGDETHTRHAVRACSWLLTRTGSTFRDDAGVLGHDPTIVGWPWIADTHSWVEPTAMAVLALRRNGFGRHARTLEGLRLIKDRAIATGGWNYGNNAVYGTALRPQPAATGMAVAALSGIAGPNDIISSACAYLEDAAANLRAPQSLCWALLGLGACNRRPPAADQWLEQAYEHVLRRGPKAPQLSYLLLAAGDDTPALLGIQTHGLEGLP